MEGGPEMRGREGGTSVTVPCQREERSTVKRLRAATLLDPPGSPPLGTQQGLRDRG